MEKDFNDFSGFGYNPYANMMNNNLDNNEFYKDPLFNPIMQYEQAYSYYKYLCIQIDYKMKCIEYEKLQKEQKQT